MNAPHLHLMVNHLPVLGTLFGAALLIAALALRDQAFQKLALAYFVLLALGGIVVYWSGDQAADRIRLLPGVAVPAIDRHAEAGEQAFIGLSVLGAVSLVLLFVFRPPLHLPRAAGIAVVLLALAVVGLAARAAWIGGHIRHPELWSSTGASETAAPAAATGRIRPGA